jgi:hypothetical protein
MMLQLKQKITIVVLGGIVHHKISYMLREYFQFIILYFELIIVKMLFLKNVWSVN